MSLDLAWDKLDAELASRLIEALNRQLSSVQRPSFIGPVEVTSFDFGTVCPDVELVDMRDIYRDFLEDSDEEDNGVDNSRGQGSGFGSSDRRRNEDDGVRKQGVNEEVEGMGRNLRGLRLDMGAFGGDEEFEWVPRPRRGKDNDVARALADEAPSYHPVMPHMRYGGGGSGGPPSPGYSPGFGPGFSFSGAGFGPRFNFPPPNVSRSGSAGSVGLGMNMGMSVPNLADMRPGLTGTRSGGMASSMYAATPTARRPLANTNSLDRDRNVINLSDSAPPSPTFGVNGGRAPLNSLPPSPSPSSHSLSSSRCSSDSLSPPENSVLIKNTHPDLQLHLRVLYHSDLRLTLSTSLLINYPSPGFLSLPIKLAVTGLEFAGEVVVAYEGTKSPRRVHICLIDELDPYSPFAFAPNRKNKEGSGSNTTSDMDSVGASASQDSDLHTTSASVKPLPIGTRLLPAIYIESEIGQADKHVLKNVTRVEKFITDVIRKTIEDELVFPNFHTIILGDG